MVAGLTAVVLAACDKDGKTTAPEGVSQQGPASQYSQESRDQFPVAILPQDPTVDNDLQAVVGDIGNSLYRWEKNGQLLAGETKPALPKTLFSKGDRVTVTVTADNKEVSASVMIGNSPPKVVSVPFRPQTINRGVDITVTPVGFDADGDGVQFKYQWAINGRELSENTPVLDGTLFKKGDQVSLTVTPYDVDGDGVVHKTIPLVIPNAAPRMVSVSLVENKGYVARYRAAAEDPDGDSLTYSLVSAPRGMAIDARTGAITWQYTREEAGTHDVEVVAQDPEGLRTFQKYSLSVALGQEVK